MKARQLIDGAAYPPEVVYAMGKAFDQAWKEIARKFADDAKRTEEARLRLAEAVISIAAEDSTHIGTLKRGALQALAEDYRTGMISSPTDLTVS